MILRRGIAGLVVAFGAVALSGCNVDTAVSLLVEPDGSGRVAVTVVIDSEARSQAPGLKDDLKVADLEANGWQVDGPDETDDGGLTVTISHGFDTPQQATVLLSSINGTKGPLKGVTLARSGSDANSTWSLDGTLEVNGGLEAFVDNETLQRLGVTPYAAQVENSGLDLGAAVTLRFVAVVPGDLAETTGQRDGNAVVWRIPMDGTSTLVTTRSENVDVAASVARIAQPVLIGLLVVWVGGIGVLAMMVKRRQTSSPTRRA